MESSTFLQRMWLRLPGSRLAVDLRIFMGNLQGFLFHFTRSDLEKWKLSVSAKLIADFDKMFISFL